MCQPIPPLLSLELGAIYTSPRKSYREESCKIVHKMVNIINTISLGRDEGYLIGSIDYRY